MELKVIAKIYTDFPSKFGIPRQSGRVPELLGKIEFENTYRNPDALRGLEGFSHLWLIWGFSQNPAKSWSATVRPPKLGGNTRVGVFATRSPNRSNPIGLSCLRLEGILKDEKKGNVLIVSGVDMADGTPVYDIKPYHPKADCILDARGGFTETYQDRKLEVVFPTELLDMIPEEKREALKEVLSEDPRPSYQDDPERKYGFGFSGKNVRFKVSNGILTVVDITDI